MKETPLQSGSLFADVPTRLDKEEFTVVARLPGARVERIVSTGQASPPGVWYDQEWNEWVVLLSGSARLRLEGEPSARAMAPGDFINIPAHRRHRVEATDPREPTIWLAIHYR